ncbi:MAG TPA: hypothetical protein VI756_01170 [Blastocatellia bacterium]
MSDPKHAGAALALAASTSRKTLLTVDFVTADIIGLTFDTMPGNQPNTYGNFVAIWQNQNEIPWNQDPLNVKPIPTNTQAGSISFDGLTTNNNSYIIGYSVGATKSSTEGQKYGNICSTAFVPATSPGGPSQYFQTDLVLTFVGTTSVAVQFTTPAGYKPATNKNWMGLWRASTASYNNPPDWSAPITLDSNFGTAAFNNVNIGRGLTYTIGYFMSGWLGQGQQNRQTALACSLTFTNAQ